MKVLVLGAGGMAGHVIALRLKEKGHDVTGLARRELSFCNHVCVDAADETEISRVLSDGNYDVVINAIGVLHEINFKPAYGIWINSYFPHRLIELLENTQTKLIHLSTDCVFGGHDGGGYKETSIPTATDYYGRSKLLGEFEDDKNLVFRMSIVGPDINEKGTGLFHWFMRQKEAVNGYAEVIWTGVSTIVLADAIDAALQQNLTGIYQLVNNDSINKYELLKLFNDLRKEKILISKTTDYSVDKSLINTRTDFDFVVPSYQEMATGMGEWIRSHKELYPWYDIKNTL